MTPVFPLTALVGADDMVTALMLAAIDPQIGGVLLRGEKGSGKTTAARGLAMLLGPGAPFVELPLGASEDRVVGSLDLRAVLTHGEHRFQPGLLSEVNGGVLYVDEVNLLADHLVDVLLDVAVSGVNRVERDGISQVHPSRFVLVGSMNPEEGELRPQLLDRFGLSVDVRSPADPLARSLAVRRRIAFDSDPEQFSSDWAESVEQMRSRLATARPVPLEAGLDHKVAELCAQAGAEGLRADLVIYRAAGALAGWIGKEVAGEAEVMAVAPLALGHRLGNRWDSPFEQGSGSAPAALKDSSDIGGTRAEDSIGHHPNRRGDQKAWPDAAVSPDQGDRGPGDRGSDQAKRHEAEKTIGGLGDRAHNNDSGAQEDKSQGESGIPRSLLDPIKSRATSSSVATGRRPGEVAMTDRGRVIGASPLSSTQIVGSLAVRETLTAAVTRTHGSGSVLEQPLRIEADDLRAPIRKQQAGNLVVLAVDASGSMGVASRLGTARDAVMALLTDAYQRRDKVAMVSFRAQSAQTVLRPTSSTEIAKARLVGMPTGGRTPLAAGIETALKVALTAVSPGHYPLLVVVSDGRATWAEGGSDPIEAAMLAARRVKNNRIASLVVDCETTKVGSNLGMALSLAEVMGSRYVGAQELVASGRPGDHLAALIRQCLQSPSG